MPLSAIGTVTSNLILEEIILMRSTIYQALLDNTNYILQEVAKHMLKVFDKYWGDLDKVSMLFIYIVFRPPF